MRLAFSACTHHALFSSDRRSFLEQILKRICPSALGLDDGDGEDKADEPMASSSQGTASSASLAAKVSPDVPSGTTAPATEKESGAPSATSSTAGVKGASLV